MSILLLGIVQALVTNVTEFDDASSDQNITSNTTKYTTLPLNSTILQANLTIKGLNKSAEDDDEDSYYCTSTDAISPCSNAVDEDFDTYTTNEAFGQTRNVSENFTLPFSGIVANWSWKVKSDFSINPCSGDDGGVYCYNYSSSELTNRLSENPSDGSTKTITLPSDCLSGAVLQMKVQAGCSGNGFTRYYEGKVVWNNGVDIPPKDIQCNLNNSVFFNHTNNLTGTNYTDFSSELETCNNFQTTCPLTCSALGFGILEYSDLFIQYNKTNSAIINIVSSDITRTITSGDSFTEQVNISNTGDWNATNISIYTVSALSNPNMNAFLSYSCPTNIPNGTTGTCNVTFTSVTQEPESDEKIKANATGTDTSGVIITQNSKDIDITVNPPVSETPTGGGGNIPIIISDSDNTEFAIVGKGGLNTNTQQLGIRPSNEKEFCLDLLNTGSDTQEVDITCETPQSSSRDACQWIELFCDSQPCTESSTELTITALPSERKRFCMIITTPADIVLGENYIVNIVGENRESLTDKHTITMTVFSGSLLISNTIAGLFDDSIAEAFTVFIQTYIKENVRQISIPNIINPALWLPFLMLFYILRKRELKTWQWTGFYLLLTILTVWALSELVIFFWIDLSLSVVSLWILLSRLILKK